MAKYKAGNYMNSGLSKSAYTAKKTAPKTKTWVPAQKATSGTGSFPVASAPGYYQEVDNTPTDLATYKQKDLAYGRDSQKSSPRVVDTNQRNQASNILAGGLFGTPTASAEGSRAPRPIPTSKETNWLGNVVGTLGQSALGVPGAIYKGVTGHNVDLGLTELLGLSKNIPGGLSQGGDYQSNLVSALTPSADQPTGYGAGDTTYYNDNVPTDTSGNVSNFYRPATPTNTNPTQNRTPQPVSNPTPPQPTSDISSIIKALIEYGQPKPDFTPVQNNPGTVQRPVGMGQFSKGQYANGAGGYGFQGSMGGNNGLAEGGMQDEQSIFNDLMGINTAQAEGFNMASPYQTASQTPYSQSPEYQNYRTALDTGQAYSPFGLNEERKPTPPPGGAPGGSQTGAGPTQQFAQGTTGGSKQQKFDSSGYKSAQKSQKKALDELIKSIKSQYATSTTEGTNALEKSKQEDLLKLSGLFNFANQDPNSEQRLQYEQRSRNDYAGQLGDFLNKLAQGQSKDISGAKQGYQGQLADIMQQEQQARNSYQTQQAQQMGRAKSGSVKPTGTKKVSHNDIFSFVNESLANGAGWEEIARGAAEQGVDTSTGSYLDQLLNQANKQGQWR